MERVGSVNVQFAYQYLKALEHGAVGDELATFFTEDTIQEEFPNRLVPSGARRGLPELLEGAERGQGIMEAQRFEVLNTLEDGNTIVLEVQWTGILAIPLGTLGAGDQMSARFAVFLELRDGKIARQRNYDCFDPWGPLDDDLDALTP